jgi:hypothetical protein
MSVVTAEQQGTKATLEQRIVAGLQLALAKAGESRWDEAWEIVEGLWSPFMARERLTYPAFPTHLDEEGGR